MTDYNSLLSGLALNSEHTYQQEQEQLSDTPSTSNMFKVEEFINDLKQKSIIDNRKHFLYSKNITAYDIAHNCIRQTIYRLLKPVITDFEDKWLPLRMRTTIGKAIHEFIQSNSKAFTETEISLKVPSLKFSGVVDCICGNDTLVEIKTCTFSDYKSIITSNRPRTADFYQSITYKYFLENHLDEIKKQTDIRTRIPICSSYNIKIMQFIYVAHDICSGDCNSFDEALLVVDNVKKMLKSKNNSFYFISCLNIPVANIDLTSYESFVVDKLKTINYYLDSNKIPPKTDKYIDTSHCFFCMFKDICDGD